jgi:hypothetical protein
MTKLRKPLQKKPVYEGERANRTTKERIHCEQPWCKRLAQYRTRRFVDGAPFDEHTCEECLRALIKAGDTNKAAELPEYRKFLHRMSRWEAQQNAGEQKEMF